MINLIEKIFPISCDFLFVSGVFGWKTTTKILERKINQSEGKIKYILRKPTLDGVCNETNYVECTFFLLW